MISKIKLITWINNCLFDEKIEIDNEWDKGFNCALNEILESLLNGVFDE